jgi:hypothetical protein
MLQSVIQVQQHSTIIDDENWMMRKETEPVAQSEGSLACERRAWVDRPFARDAFLERSALRPRDEHGTILPISRHITVIPMFRHLAGGALYEWSTRRHENEGVARQSWHA